VIDQPGANLLAGDVSELQPLGCMTSLSPCSPTATTHIAIHHSADWIRDLWLGYAAGRPTSPWRSLHGDHALPSVILTIRSTLPDEFVIPGSHEDSTVSGCSAT
jgi:hypothetical protein